MAVAGALRSTRLSIPVTAPYRPRAPPHHQIKRNALLDTNVRLNDKTQDFVERHAAVIAGAKVVVADGNLPPEGFAQVARLCARENVPLVFEPTSVAKSSVPFLAGVSLFRFFQAAKPTPALVSRCTRNS